MGKLGLNLGSKTTKKRPLSIYEGDSIKVLVRIRPHDPSLTESSHGTLAENICLQVGDDGQSVEVDTKPLTRFTFDSVSDVHSTQEHVFTTAGKKIVESCVDGYNGTIFAYGQTGSGKTFTMLGPSEGADGFQHEIRGLIPRAFDHLFTRIKEEKEINGGGGDGAGGGGDDARKDESTGSEKKKSDKTSSSIDFVCKCSFLEIYNEQVYDLLDPCSMQNCVVRESNEKGVYVEGLMEQAVTSAADAYQVLTSGWINRRVASTNMNRESSRSHAVFTVSVSSTETKPNGAKNIKTCRLNLIDLAGSERQRDTRTEGARLKEAGSINKSLSALGNVICALVDKEHGKTRHVPYRDSKLSFLLRDSLGGNAKTYIIACVHPGSKCMGESISTLRFAQRAKMIKNNAVVNEDTQGNVPYLKGEIRKLKDFITKLQSSLGLPPRLPLTPNGSLDCGNNTKTADCIEGGISVFEAAFKAKLEDVGEAGVGKLGGEGKSQWKENFLRAMFFRGRSEEEKKNLEDRTKHLEEICRRKENLLMQNKMIVKFRDSRIERLEEVVKKSGMENTSERILELEAELKTMKEKLEQRPLLRQMAFENDTLKKEIKKLKQEKDVTDVIKRNSDLVQELESTYWTLVSNEKADVTPFKVTHTGSISPCGTPTPTGSGGAEKGVSMVALERYRQQTNSLQRELLDKKEEMAEQATLFDKRKEELEAELATLTKTNRELVHALEAVKLKSRIEREEMNDIHMQTIRALAPKNTSSSSSSSPKPKNKRFPSVGEEQNSPMGSFSRLANSGAPGLSEEAMPEEMLLQEGIDADDVSEALAEEVKRFSEMHLRLKTQLETAEEELRVSKSAAEKASMEKKDLQMQLVVVKDEFKTKDDEAKEKIAELQKLLADVQQDNETLRSEVMELRIVEASTKKTLESEKLERREYVDEKLRQLEGYEVKLNVMEEKVEKAEQENEALLHNQRDLEDALLRLDDEVSIEKDHARKSKEKYREQKSRAELAEERLRCASEALAREIDKNEKIATEIGTQGQEQDVRHLKVVEENNQMQRHIAELENVCTKKNDEMVELRKTMDALNGQIKNAQRDSQDKDKVIHDVKTMNETYKNHLRNKEEQLLSLTSNVDAISETVDNYQQINLELRTRVEQFQAEIADLQQTLDGEQQRHKFEAETLREDLETLSGHHTMLQAELRNQTQQLESSQQEMRAQARENARLQQELDNKRDELRILRKDCMTPQPSMTTSLSTSHVGGPLEGSAPSIVTKMRMQILESAELLDSYKRRQGELIEKLEEYERNREEKNQEIAQLKLQLQEEESMHAEVDKWQRRYQNINYELEVQKTKMKESIEGAWDSEQELFIQELIDKSESAVKAKEEMLRENSSLQEENEQQGALLRWMEEQQEELQEELERLKGLIAVSYGEAEGLRSQIEELKEERVKNIKEIGFWRGEFDRSIQNETQRIYYHTQTSQNQMQQLMDIKLKYSASQYSSVDNNGGDDNDNGNAARSSSSSSSSSGSTFHSAMSVDNAVNNANRSNNANGNNNDNANNKEVFAPSESCFIIDEGSVTFNK